MTTKETKETKIRLLQAEIAKIESGFDERFPLGKPVSTYATGVAINKQANNLVKMLELVNKQEIIKTRLDLKETKIIVRTDKQDSGINQNFVIKTLEDFMENCSKTYQLFNFELSFDEGFNNKWSNLNKITTEMTESFKQDAQLNSALTAQNNFFSESVKRLKMLYDYRTVYHPFDSSRWLSLFKCPEEYALQLMGISGGEILAILKYTAGDKWETDFKPILYDFIYNQIRDSNPVESLKTLHIAKLAKGDNLSKEVADEFFPVIDDLKILAEHYTDIKNQKTVLEIEISEM